MPVTTIEASEAEHVAGQAGTSLRTAAELTSGTAAGSALNMNYTYVSLGFINIYINYRSFLTFDLSSLSSDTITDVTLRLYSYNTILNGTTADMYILAAENTDAIGSSDYEDGITGATDYPFTSDATKYIDTPWAGDTAVNAGDTIDISLNAAAISAAQSAAGSGKFKIALVNEYDYDDTYDSTSINDSIVVQGRTWSSDEDTGKEPELLITTGETGIANTKILSGNLKIYNGKLKIL